VDIITVLSLFIESNKNVQHCKLRTTYGAYFTAETQAPATVDKIHSGDMIPRKQKSAIEK